MVRKYCITIFILALTIAWANGQSALKELSLTKAYELLDANYPMLKNNSLIEGVLSNELESIDKSRLPAIFLKAEGRLQSQSASLDLPEGVVLPFTIDLPLYSTKAYVEAQYSIFDGKVTEAQKHQKEAQAEADLQNLEVDRFALRERINQLFININLLREQAKLFDISIEDLSARKERVRAGVEEGVLLESELNKIKVKELELAAQQDNLRFKISGLIQTLSYFIGTEADEHVKLVLPALPAPKEIPEIVRPEQEWFQLQRQAILANNELITASRKPRLAAYAQAGTGYPNPLNFLDNNLAPFGIVGLQFSWKITDWKKEDLDRETLSLQAMKIKNAEETFDFNLQSGEKGYLAEVDRLSSQLNHDREIVQLQGNILSQMAAQLDEGVITSSEYITQVNTELLARQNMLIHQIELQNAQLEFWSKRGGF